MHKPATWSFITTATYCNCARCPSAARLLPPAPPRACDAFHYDVMTAVTSLGNAKFSAPLSSHGTAVVSHYIVCDWIHSSQRQRQAKGPSLNNCVVAYLYVGILCSQEKEGDSVIHYNTGETWEHMVSERSQSRKDKYSMLPLTRRIRSSQH